MAINQSSMRAEDAPVPAPSRRDWAAVVAALLVLSALAWAAMVGHLRMAGMAMAPAAPRPLALEALGFLAVWTAMMAAMMFPSVYPMVALFAAVSRQRRGQGALAVPTWIFVAGYLLAWAGFGAFVFGGDRIARTWPAAAGLLAARGGMLAGVVLVAAGLYQWSPLKYVCLRHCRSPIGFILHDWREGPGGALRMGVHHGAYCVGCCWALMAVQVALGVMNLPVMLAVAVLIFLEKITRFGEFIARAAGAVFILAGALLLLRLA
jgi:predicted metal-binding membrane protein